MIKEDIVTATETDCRVNKASTWPSKEQYLCSGTNVNTECCFYQNLSLWKDRRRGGKVLIDQLGVQHIHLQMSPFSSHISLRDTFYPHFTDEKMEEKWAEVSKLWSNRAKI